MSDDQKVGPALTAEDWTATLHRRSNTTTTADLVAEGGKLHRIAALCLYGQPFGFTHEDVAMLHQIADIEPDDSGNASLSYGESRYVIELAARIAALLPPNGFALHAERGGLSALSPDEEQHLRDSL